MAEGYEPKYRCDKVRVSLTDNDDLDNCTNLDVYYDVSFGRTPAHSPGEGYTIYCITGNWGPIQIAFNYVLTDIKFRIFFGSWREWKKITLTDIT